MTRDEETPDQWEEASRVLFGLLQLQTNRPGAISVPDLPQMLLISAQTCRINGDNGAARLLEAWVWELVKPPGKLDS